MYKIKERLSNIDKRSFILYKVLVHLNILTDRLIALSQVLGKQGIESYPLFQGIFDKGKGYTILGIRTNMKDITVLIPYVLCFHQKAFDIFI